MQAEAFVPLDQIAGRLNQHPATVRRALHRAGRSLFTNPADRRRRLVAAEDAAWLLTPRKVGEKEAA